MAAIADTTQPFGSGNLYTCRRGKKGSIVLASLWRPKTRNAFNDDLYEDLIQLLGSTAADPSVSAVVLTGVGSYFSSGADLRDGNYIPETGSGRQTMKKPAGRFMMALIAYPKVLCAAVQGPAVGIGVTLLMHCDIVHCSATASLWAPFTRLALVPELCSSVTFLETMGLSKANELLLLGKRIDANKALNWNLCSEVVTDCDASGDPFHTNSLASRMCKEIDHRLLSLPLGDTTADVFVSFIKGARRQRMEQVCRTELLKLDERFDTGQVQQAASHIQIGSKKSKGPRSKL
jgi:enoyl-CoA hydratase/carnithine racemase